MLLITKLIQTCGACPSQWYGKSIDDNGIEHEIYIRYRWGYLRLDVNDNTTAGKDMGDPLGVVMAEQQSDALNTICR